MRLALLTAILMAAAASPAAARSADYEQDENAFAADADALNVETLPPLPVRGDADVVLENADVLDHQLRILGMGCSVWKVDNPLSQMVTKVLGLWDRDGVLETPSDRSFIRLRFDNARSFMRCVQVSELESRCLARTLISGEATVANGTAPPRIEPIAIEVEHEQNGAACSVARGAGLSGRSSSIALVKRLREIAAP